MSKAYTSQDNILRVIECYKLGLKKKNKEISRQTGVNTVTVRRLMFIFKAAGERKIPCHRHGGGWLPKVNDRTLTLIRRQLEKNPTLTARLLMEQNPILLQEVSVRTNIHKKLEYQKYRARNKHFVSEEHRKKEAGFCMQIQLMNC